MDFCVAILILKMEENKQCFQCIMLYSFKKGNNATETQKKICAVSEKVSNVSKVVCEVLCWRFLLGWCSTVRQTNWCWWRSNRDIADSQHYTTWETADTRNISKSIKLLVKMKNVSFILWKKVNEHFGQTSIIISKKLWLKKVSAWLKVTQPEAELGFELESSGFNFSIFNVFLAVSREVSCDGSIQSQCKKHM